LLVDDNPVDMAELCDLLDEANFSVYLAKDGATGLRMAKEKRPDLVLLDVMLPDMNGFAICQALKQDPATREAPVLFMTAVTDTAEKVNGFELGAVDYITKPFQQDEVLARVTTHLALQQLKHELQEKEERLSRILEDAMDAIITLDPRGHITLFNAAAEKVFRCKAAQAHARPITGFLTPALWQVVSDFMHGDPPKRALWVPEGLNALRADGEEFPIEAPVSRVRAVAEEIFTLILRDINERRKAAAERNQLRGINQYLEEEVRAAHNLDEIIGRSKAMDQVLALAGQVAGTDATVLITGETGTGKELIARAVHKQSQRRDKVFVKLNCAAIPADLAESELFGHEKGAFTGAVARKSGRFELADGGTLFLDEVGELPLDLQAKLLRVLQEGEYERVGGTRTLTCNVRIVAATNRDLAEQSSEGRFRADLFYRLNVFPIALPPLRERKEDIPALAEYFLAKYCKKIGRTIEAVEPEVMATLCGYSWPGNVRELEHVIERAVILSRAGRLELGNWFGRSSLPLPEPEIKTLDALEREHILNVLQQTGWRISGPQGAARLLGLNPTTLEARIKKLGLTRPV
jgi:PAS domain S-box-containing protein